MQTKATIRFFTIADYEKEQEYIFALLFGILICLYLLVCKNICKLLNNRMHAPRHSTSDQKLTCQVLSNE